jgi:MHS family proline/betaine transporter-like MFS transporter
MKPTQTKQIILSCFLASTLEIYDFAIFGFLSTAIYKNYLSFLDEQTSLFVTFIFFAIGFIFRPFGSLVFGYIGDTFGRKKALVTSISMMGVCSLGMFILPSYTTIGIASCYIIVLIRIIQGISVGGEFTGAIIFTMEHMSKHNRGFAIGVLSAGGACGVLLASFISKVLQNPNLPEYSWRFAFLLGFSLAIVGYFIRQKLHDTKEFNEIKDQRIKFPLLEGMRSYKLESISTVLVAAANGTCFYFGAIFLPKHLNNVRSEGDYGYVSLVISLTMFLALPIFGYVSDKFDRKKYLIVASILMSIVGLFFINLITFAENNVSISIFSIIYTLFAAMMIGGINIYAAEIFPMRIRMSCMSLFYSIGMGVIGGTVPMLSAYIANRFGNPEYILGAYISFICLAASISVMLVRVKGDKKLKKTSLNITK